MQKKKGIIQREQGRIEETPRSGQNQNTLILEIGKLSFPGLREKENNIDIKN